MGVDDGGDGPLGDRTVKHGIFLPPFNELADPRRVAALAADAEQAGWDGFYVWDHVLAEPGMAVAEAWTTLAAIAMATSHIRIGALVTPLARRRPWVLARQIAMLDQLSGGGWSSASASATTAGGSSAPSATRPCLAFAASCWMSRCRSFKAF